MTATLSFNSPLAKHLQRNPSTDGGVPQRSERRTAGHSPASITGIQITLPRGGEPLGVSSPTGSAGSWFRPPGPAASTFQSTADSAALGQAAGALQAGQPRAAVQCGGIGTTASSSNSSATSIPTVQHPTSTLEGLVASKQRAAVAAAAAAMHSPAVAAARPSLKSSFAFTTPIAKSSTPPGSSSTEPLTQLPHSFKQQAQQLLQERQRSTAARSAAVSTTVPTGLATIGGSQRHRSLLQRPSQQQQQQQHAPCPAPPTESLEDALGQLQLESSSLAAAAATASTPGLRMRSRGLLTLLSTPRAAAAMATAAGTPLLLPPSMALQQSPDPQLPATQQEPVGQPQPHRQQVQQQQALWSPMLPAAAAPSSAQGAGLLGTLRKSRAPAEGTQEAPERRTDADEAASAAGLAPISAALATTENTPHPAAAVDADGWSLAHPELAGTDNPAQLRRQLQEVVPELTVTLPPPASAASSSSSQQPQSQQLRLVRQRPAGLADRTMVEGLLARVAQLQAAAGALLQEQAAATNCAGVAATFRSLRPSPGGSGDASSALVTSSGRQQEQPRDEQERRRQQRQGPSGAALQRLAQLRQLQAAGTQMAAQFG